jgi:uncharacterized protein YdeI (BOF family)
MPQQPMQQQPMQQQPMQQKSMQEGQMSQQKNARASARPDDSWVTLNGRVRSATATGFTLDYGSGQIPVSMDTWSWYRSDHDQIEGNRVTVYGRIDDAAMQRRTIDASSVYVQNLNTFFYASAEDEQDMAVYSYNIIPIGYSDTRVTGIVQNFDATARTITVDQGAAQVLVDLSQLAYNPLDKDGYQQIQEGDRVLVAGDMQSGFFEPGRTSAVDQKRRGIIANAVVTLREDVRMAR